MRTLLLASALFAGLFGSLAAVPVPAPVPIPYHAFCRTLWWVRISDLVLRSSFYVSRVFECEFRNVFFLSGMFNIIWFQMKVTELLMLFLVWSVNVSKVCFYSFSRLFATPCTEITTKVVQQIQAFSPLAGCEECQYMVRTTSVHVDHVLDEYKWTEINSNIYIKEIYNVYSVMFCCLLFQLVSATPLSVKANHTSLDGLQAESITFKMSPTVLTGGCRVTVSISDAIF